MALTTNAQNAAQIEHWNGPAGETWVKLQARLDTQLAPLGRLAMDLAAVRTGEAILDVGCGTGETTLELSRRVGPGGKVLGVDGRARCFRSAPTVKDAGFPQTRFEEGDAQTMLSLAATSISSSRASASCSSRTPWRPSETYARRSRMRGGWLSFAGAPSPKTLGWRCPWRRPSSTFPAPAVQPGAPGEFAFADRDRVHGILSGAGFRDITIEPEDMLIGGASLEVTVDTTLSMGPVAAALREADPAKREPVEDAVRRALAPYDGSEGVRLGAGVWVVQARSAVANSE